MSFYLFVCLPFPDLQKYFFAQPYKTICIKFKAHPCKYRNFFLLITILWDEIPTYSLINTYVLWKPIATYCMPITFMLMQNTSIFFLNFVLLLFTKHGLLYVSFTFLNLRRITIYSTYIPFKLNLIIEEMEINFLPKIILRNLENINVWDKNTEFK